MSEVGSGREQLLSRAFVGLADTLVDDYDIIDLSERAVRRGEVVTEQLQTALNNRMIIEQAKGVLAQRGNLSMNVAFDRLRRYARNRNALLSEVARQVVETDLAAEVLGAPATHSKAVDQR